MQTVGEGNLTAFWFQVVKRLLPPLIKLGYFSYR